MVEVDESDIDMSCSKSGCPLEANSTVTVHVRGEFQLITPILGFIFGGQTLGLDTAATQQIEYFPVGGVSTLPPTPVAAFTASDLTGEAPFAVSFDGTSSSGSPTDYRLGLRGWGVCLRRRPGDARLRRRRDVPRRVARDQPGR